MGGSGGGGDAPPPPIPSSPTRWLYDRSGDPTTLQEYGHYERAGDGSQFTLVNDNKPLAAGLYLSPEAASAKNPKVWLYDDKGKTVKQVFKGGEGPDDAYDTSAYNLGPDNVPYRHWYDIYGVGQEYAPVATEMPQGYWESPNKAPKSSTFQAPTPFNEVDPSLNVQPEGNTSTSDIAATKNQAKKRRISGSKQLTLLGDSESMGSSGDNKTLLGE